MAGFDPTLDVHEWISFDDEHEDRTWVFDATFLRSSWSCIYGEGCQGVLDADASAMAQGCCSYGAHFVDEEDLEPVIAAAARLTSKQWQFRKQGRRDGFFDVAGANVTTKLVKDACIFLNRPGFEGGVGCALHHGALAAGERPMDWKPNVCWQLPLRLDHQTDDHGHLTSTLREWKRRDWGPGGLEFHWWCTDSHEAFVGRDPVYVYLRDEIVALIGEAAYGRLVEMLERPTWVPLPHPAARPVTVRRKPTP